MTVHFWAVTLQKIVLPENLRKIGNEAFENCTALEEAILPESLSEIGDYAFTECKNLKEITIPANVKKIGYDSLGYNYYFNGPWETVKNYDFTLSGYSGGAVEKYASDNNIPFNSLGEVSYKGDINNDKTIDASDALDILSLIVSGNTADSEIADVNGDGQVTSEDALMILNYIVGNIYL